MSTETVRDEDQISEQVRNEQIDTTGVTKTGDTPQQSNHEDRSNRTQ